MKVTIQVPKEIEVTHILIDVPVHPKLYKYAEPAADRRRVVIGVQDASAAWVNKVYEAAQFFTDLGSATDGWGFSGADFDSHLFQLFPEGDAHAPPR